MDLGPTFGDPLFIPKRKTFKLAFDDEHAGLVVRCRSVPVGKFLELASLAGSTTGSAEDSKGQLGAVAQLFAMFGDVLLSWNVADDDGTPVPATANGLLTLDIDLAMKIVSEWIKAATGVSTPLDPGSTDGSRSVELSIPMAPPSTNPTS